MFKINEKIKIILMHSIVIIVACDQNVGKRDVGGKIDVQNEN